MFNSMQQQYDKACSIRFRHAFFADNKPASLSIEPHGETALLLKKTGGLAKPFAGGIHVLYESLFAGSSRSREAFLQDAQELFFMIRNTDSLFFCYTSGLDTDPSTHCCWFENNTDGPAQSERALHPGPFADKSVLRPLGQCGIDPFAKPFGIIRLILHQNLENEFTISFAGASTHWCYVLTKDYLLDLSQPAIISKQTKEAFLGPEPIRLADDRRALAFVSPQPIDHRQQQPAHYQLVDVDAHTNRHRMVLPVLPHPDPRYISSVDMPASRSDKNLSYIFI